MMHRVLSADGVACYRSSRLDDVGVPHAFSTRVGGVSEGSLASLHLGLACESSGAEREAIEENFERLQGVLGLSGAARIEVRQVHGGSVVHADSVAGAAATVDADAIISERDDQAATIRVADCVPVLLSAADGRAVAAVHAGWRGIVAGVIPAAVQALRARVPERGQLVAAIGPCLSCERFEVGDEVVDAFAGAGLIDTAEQSGDGRARIDLRRAALHQLRGCAIALDCIDVSDRCTWDDEAEFFSHRRDAGDTGRMAAMIAPL